MKRSRKIFLLFIVVFCSMIGYLVVDISRRTTFPGTKLPSAKKAVAQDSSKADSAGRSSIR